MPDLRSGLLVGRTRAIFVGVILATTLAAVADAVLSPEEWVGWLPTTVGAWESGAAWTPSVICVAAAWLVGQPRAHRMTEWVSTSPRSREEQVGVAAFFLASALAIALAISALIVGGISVYFGLLDGLFRYRTLLLAPGFIAYLYFWLALGAILGDKLRRELALPIAAVAPYAAYAVLALYSDNRIAALAVGDGRNYSYVEPSVSTMVARAGFWTSVAIAVWASILGRRHVAATFRWVTGVCAAAALFIGAVILPIPNATSATCAGASPRACLESSFASALPRYRAAIESLWADVPEPLRTDVVVSVPDIGPRGTSTLIAPPVAGYSEPARLVEQTMFEARVGDALFLTPCIRGRGGDETALVLTLWWRRMMNVPLDGSAYAGDTNFRALDPDFDEHLAEATSFASLPAPERLAWFEANAGSIRACGGSELPT